MFGMARQVEPYGAPACYFEQPVQIVCDLYVINMISEHARAGYCD